MELSRLTGGPLDGYVATSDELPASAPTDRIQIVGPCDAYYLGTGDEFHPWAEVDTRSATIRVDPDASAASSAVAAAVLATFTGRRTLRLELVREPFTERFRLQLVGGDASNIVPPKEFSADRPFRITIEGEDRTYYRVSVEDLPRRAPSLRVPRESFAADWVFQPNVLRPSTPESSPGHRSERSSRSRTRPLLEQCEELLP